MYKILIVSGLLISASIISYSQSVIQPNYGLKSHETLEINKIELTQKATVFYLSVENRIENGNFCADKNIFIIYPDGTRIKMISSNGIPVCPATYKFNSIGEKLNFTLTFPTLKPGTDWIDLVEECSENCFSFYGITLDNVLNNRLNEAFALSESGESAKALISLIDLITEFGQKNYGIEGLIYMNIIKLARANGDTSNATEWYRKLKTSGAPRLQLYISHLNSQGINYK
jgi:hypothetical protein